MMNICKNDSFQTLHTCKDNNSINEPLKCDTTIDQLNDDCLEHIFLFLPIIDRIKIEIVCKRWKTVVNKSWHNCKELNLSKESWAFDRRKIFDSKAVFNVLMRCRCYLTCLQFYGYMENLNNSLVKIGPNLGFLCPNLHTVDLFGVSKAMLQSLAYNCRNIVQLKLEGCLHTCDHELSLLFSNNRKLKMLNLIYCNMTGECLLNLPSESVESIRIVQGSLLPEYFCNAIQKLKKLSSLTFYYCEYFNNDIIKAISSLKSLKEIQTGYRIGNVNSLIPITKLNNLKKIELSYCDCVDDKLLIILCQNCTELSDVNISACFNVSNAGLECVTSLPKLEHLAINRLKIKGLRFCPMPNLKMLECSFCSTLSNKSCITILTTSKNLKLFNLCHTGISNKVIKAAIQITMQRTNNIILKLYIAGCRHLKLNEVQNKSPSLELINILKFNFTKNY